MGEVDHLHPFVPNDLSDSRCGPWNNEAKHTARKGEKMETNKELGCRINALSIAELFEHYDHVGFLYPEKKSKISSVMPLIRKNWESALKADDDILWIVSHEEKESSHLATLTVWRSTTKGAFSQHCTSTGRPHNTRAVLLGAQSKTWLEGRFTASQNWFRPTNKFANKVFGTIGRSIDKDVSSVKPYNYLAVKVGLLGTWSGSTRVVRCRHGNSGIYELALKLRGKVYAEAEELAGDDIELEELNEVYCRVGLRRKRYVWMAFCRPYSEPVGAVIAYRGPLGLNLSLLENRCDLLVDESLDEVQAASVCNALMKKVAIAYADFPFDYVPVVADERCANMLVSLGATLTRQYAQSIWLGQGMPAWYEHVSRIFQVVERRMNRQRNKKPSVIRGEVNGQQAIPWQQSRKDSPFLPPQVLPGSEKVLTGTVSVT